MAEQQSDRAAEANRMYWEGNLSVAAIAEELEISRRALYDAVIPTDAGAECPQCGGPLQYVNRSSRAALAATCAQCGAEADLGSERSVEAPPPASAGAQASERELRERSIALGGAALAGALLGALATFAAVRRGR